MRSPELGMKERIALALAVLLARGSMEFASAQTLTPTPTRTATPTSTSTPNAVETQIADLDKIAESLRKQNADATKIADARATVSALQGTPTRTPVPTSTPADIVCIDRQAFNDFIKGSAEVALTAQAGQGISTPRVRQPEIIPTPERTGGRENQGGGISGILWFVLGGAGVFGWDRRQQVITRVRQGIERVRNRFGGGGAGAPGAGGPPAVP